jgi:hypothetical protein
MVKCLKEDYNKDMEQKQVDMHVKVNPEFRARIKIVLAKEGKTFNQLFHELFENYLQQKGE